jgi:hypothetical protein
MLTTQSAIHPRPTFGSSVAKRGTQMTLDQLKRWLITRSNFIDQRAVVQKAGAPVNSMMLAAGAAYTGWNAYKAKPEDRRKTLIRDVLVLTAAIGGSVLAAKRFKPIAEEGELLVESALKNLGILKEKGSLTQGAKDFQDAFGHTPLLDTLKKHFKGFKEKDTLTTKDLETLYDKIAATSKVGKEKVGQVFEMLFDNGEGFKQEMLEALKFFGIGGIGVLSGIGGGLLANKINGVNDRDAVPNMIKEGIFQFVANIALCAVGAGAALCLLNADQWAPGKTAKRIAGNFTGFVNNSPLKKLYRTGIVMMGLCLGIFGGSHIANYVGQKYVNPLLDKLQGKQPSPEQSTGKRKLEVCDMMLHMDDVPTAMAIAGTAVLGPWIIPFFPISGYRAGIGYRNDESAKKGKAAANAQNTPGTSVSHRFTYPTGFAVQGAGMQHQPPFASYYSHPSQWAGQTTGPAGYSMGVQPFGQMQPPVNRFRY